MGKVPPSFRSLGPWEATIESDHGNVQRAQSKDVITYSGELISNKSKKRAKKLYQIEYDKYN